MDLDPTTFPDLEDSPPPYGAVIDLPFELPDQADPVYADLDQGYDPDEDWRDVQAQHILAMYGDEQPWDQEATNG